MFTNIRVKRIISNYDKRVLDLTIELDQLRKSKIRTRPDKTKSQGFFEGLPMDEYFSLRNKFREESLKKIAKFNLKAINPLISIYKESDSGINRELAFEALIRLKDERVNSIIDKALKDKNPEIRKLAKKAKKT